MSTTLRIAGARPADDGESYLQTSPEFAPKVKRALDIDATRATGPETRIEVEKDDVLELELEDGVRLWTSYEQFEDDAAKAGLASRNAREAAFPSHYPSQGKERGIAGLAIKGLKLLGFDLPGEVAEIAARAIENRIKHGLHMWREDGKLVSGEVEATDDPVLVFLHGTASSTDGSFGGLLEDQENTWRRLHHRYEKRVFALEHRTLSQSPLRNAIDLLESLPPDARLHLVSHSRGGLVGELVAHGRVVGTTRKKPFSAEMIAGYDRGATGDRKPEIELLKRLNVLLGEKRPRVERFVRVACPAKGTTLASKRLDLYLSTILNLLGHTGLGAHPVYGMVSDLLIAVAKERTDPEDLPGLEAMMPRSPLIRLLNTSGLELEADLSVIAGDCEGDGLRARLKQVLDAFYLEDHDLIVNTSSMDLGAQRRGTARSYFTSGPKVDHFSYFRNSDTAQQVLVGLEREDDDLGGFGEIGAVREVRIATDRDLGDEPKPIVLLLPGIMGSQLAVGSNRYWLDPPALARGKLSELRVSQQGVWASGLIGLAYADLVEYLGGSRQVLPFPFDWRLSILSAADRLEVAVRRQLDREEAKDQPIHLLAHSMGGLVARALIARRPELWDELRDRGGRLVMLGTPTNGSWTVPRALLGREKLVSGLALLDVWNSRSDLLRWFSQYPGLLEMLPADDDHDLFAVSTWRDLKNTDDRKWSVPTARRLAQARRTRKLLDGAAIDADHMFYVAGVARQTPIGLGPLSEGIVFRSTAEGDGRVPWKTGIPEGIHTWYVDTSHGNLADHRPAFDGIADLLERGDTKRLDTAPPVSRGEEVPTRMDSEDEVVLFPDAQELAAAALGLDLRRRPTAKPPLRVSVAHGNLAFARSMVMVGHYKSDAIVSAESALDRRLDGRLSLRHQANLYPGPTGTAEVIFSDETDQHPTYGALVVGLGDVGDLTAGALSATVQDGVVRYALAAREEGRAPDTDTIALSSLLIGTGEAGIGLRDAVEAIIHGVTLANQRIAERLSDTPCIGEIAFVELFEDRAMNALAELESIASAGGKAPFVLDPELRRLDGGYRRVYFREPQGWWARLIISTVHEEVPSRDSEADERPRRKNELIRFQTLGQRARAASTHVGIQRRLVDQLVRQATASTRATSEDLTSTLFELLVPRELKAVAAEQRNLVLVLDEESARHPWEMLFDRSQRGGKPLGVSAGLLRQLKVEDPEPVVHSYDRNALVVGDPPSCLVELGGAQREAKRVVKSLRAGNWTVTTEIRHQERVTPTSVLRALMAHDYRVLHLAGHGLYDRTDPMRSGMVLSCKRGKEEKLVDLELLTPNEVRQMRTMPELVFINCCHLGHEEKLPHEDPHGLASNLASQFIKMGVRAVVAAGWAVDDAAAVTFATKFYRLLLDGETFGMAVRGARSKTFGDHPGTNTWGAYQCYGDPGFRLVLDARTGGWSGWSFRHKVEAMVELGNRAAAAKSANTIGKREARHQQVKDIEKVLKTRGWLEDPEICSALGAAFRATHNFGPAVHYLERARAAEDAQVSVKRLEMLANVRTRWAKEEFVAKRMSRTRAIRQIRKAISEVKHLLKLGHTSERHSLLGSSYKRLAFLQKGPNRQKSLQRMTGEYRSATRIGEVKYPKPNVLMGILLQGGPWNRQVGDNEWTLAATFDQVLDDLETRAPLDYHRERSFWNAIMEPDCGVLRGLRQRDLSTREEKIMDGYEEAKNLGGSPRQWDSVLWQFELALEILRSPGRRTKGILEVKGERDALAQIYAKVKRLAAE